MRIILLTKPNSSGEMANLALHKRLKTTNIETLWVERGQPMPLEYDFRCEWLVSYLCPWVLPAKILDQADGNMNFHPGPPEYPGIGCYNFALYEGADVFGVTCHRMEQRVDSGEIYGVSRFPISPNSRVDTLQDEAHEKLFTLYLKMIDRISHGERLTALPGETWARAATSTRDMEALRCIPLDAGPEEVERRIRAFAHRSYPGACIELHGRRFYMPYEHA